MVMCLIAAAASWMRGKKYVHDDGTVDDVEPFGAPRDPDAAGSETPTTDEWVPA